MSSLSSRRSEAGEQNISINYRNYNKLTLNLDFWGENSENTLGAFGLTLHQDKQVAALMLQSGAKDYYILSNISTQLHIYLLL